MDIKKGFIKDLKDVPKTEIHLHIEAVTTVNTVWTLIKKYNLNIEGITSKDDLESRYKISSLSEFIDLFINVIQASFKEASDFELIMDDLENYLKDNGIVYAEVFLAPTTFLKNGINFKDIIEVLGRRADALEMSQGIDIRYIIDVSRGFGADNAMKNLDLTLKYKTDRIIGIGLGGAEKIGKAEVFKDVFKKAKEAGLHIVAHAGEDADFNSINSAIENLEVERIGHGISAMESEECMLMLKKKQIPLEVCPTSNLFTGAYVTDIKKHPIRMFYDAGIFVTVNSDDPALFGSTLVEEYAMLLSEDIFNKREIGKLIFNNLMATFMDSDKKSSLQIKILDSLNNKGYL